MTSEPNYGEVRRSKKVCIVRRAYYPEETHTRRNAETLLQKGYSIDIICERDTNQLPYEVVRGVQVFRLAIGHKRHGVLRYVLEYIVFSLWASMKLTWLHLKKKYDVIEIESMPDFLVFAGLIPKLLGSKVILYLFEDMPELMASKFCLGNHNFIIKFLALVEKLSTNYADYVIVCHELSCQKLLYQRKVKTPITVILNVPDEGVFGLSVRNANRAHPKDGPFTIVHHGTITENYGIQIIIEAVSLLREQIPIRLKIFGKGEYRRTLKDLAKTLGVKEEVNFMGYVSQEKLSEETEKADAGVVALLNEYQSPNKVFELVAMGKPVIVSSLQTIRQHFNGDSLKYFRVGDAKNLMRCILELYRNPSQRASLVANASNVYEKYRWSRMKKRYLKVYDFCQGKRRYASQNN
jgi:glycosyltransferase involved in cell wall biosynthesis